MPSKSHVILVLSNPLVPHPDKCKAMIMQRRPFIGPIQALHLGNNTLNWTTSERLLRVHVDNKMTWSDLAANVAKSLASTPTHAVPSPKASGRLLYESYIAIGHVRRSCLKGSCNKTHFSNLEKLHARAGRVVYGLPWDTGTAVGQS